MAVKTFDLTFRTKGNNDTVDITDSVRGFVEKSGITEGMATVFVPGSTGGVTTIEYEPGVVSDLSDLLDKLIPRGSHYKHDLAWGDGNAHSHMRAAVIGPSLSVPISGGSLKLGTWQQIVFIDFDNRSRSRRITVQVIGE
ncbi:MAG: secondary thiamine-phosphate synthase enzyme YjbQ [Candidatus Glassbacteria bacterium]